MTDKIKYDSVFCKTKDPYSTVEWESRDSKIVNTNGETIFELLGIESPKSWSQMAVNVVASKYFYPNKEKSIKQIIDRIASTIAKYGLEDGYFDGKASADNFYKDLAWLMLHQHGSFNSPVWFNLGISEVYPEVMKESDKSGYYYDIKTESVLPVGKTYEKPQVSACFLQSVKDDMGSIMDLAKSEAMLFKHGSGTGTDLSSLRSSREEVSGGGEASGPLSFLKIYDTIAGVIRSAGRIRRSAKLNVLGVSHPDIKEWIHAKVNEEAKAKALIDAGYSSDFGGEAYSSVAFQNANLSVKITDDFMDAVKKDKKWATKLVSNPKKSGPVYKATEIFNWIAECAHKCGDPGVQFNDTMNQWHTCPVSAPCNTTNPCQPAFAKVTTPEGVVSFGSLKAGSVVWTGKGYTDVIRKVRTGVKPVYEYVTPAGSFVGTEDHKVISKGVRIKVKDADTIDNIVGNPNTSIEDVIYLGDYDVYDIEVADPEHVYVTDNLIVSNCSEFVFVDNSACNLASLNLIKFKTEKDGQPDFDFDKFRSAVNVFATAQEIIIDRAAYPTQEIAQNSHDFRPIGLGYSNLGALLMSCGSSYGSEAGREFAGVITSAMTAYAYSMSIELAKVKGAFKHFELNKKEMIKVLKLHRKHAHKLHNKSHTTILDVWDSVIDQADSVGVRHAQVTLLAPTGCVSADTLVTTSEGLLALEEIGNKSGEQWQDIDLDVKTDARPQAATSFYVNGYKDVISIRTATGFELKGTPEHCIRVIDTSGEYIWKSLDDVSADDTIPIQLGSLCGTSNKASLVARLGWLPSEMSVELAELLGMYFSNGYIHTSSSSVDIFVDAKDYDVIDYIEKVVKKLFNKKVVVKKVNAGACYRVIIYSTDIINWFIDNGWAKSKGIHGEGAASVFIPIQVRTSDEAVVAGFIRGYFQCDGTISTHPTGNSCSVELCSVSSVLAKQMQVLLANLGIVTILWVDTARTSSLGSRPLYRLRVKNTYNTIIFKERVGFIGARKNNKFKMTVKSPDASHFICNKKLISDFISSAHHLPSKLQGDIGVRERQGRANVEYIRRLVRNHPELGESSLGKLVANNWYFDRLGSKEYSRCETFDISVPVTNTYIANGFISHNTIGFQMDCDTTGVEPDIALVKYKNLVGGGTVQLVNHTVPAALKTLGYSDEQIKVLTDYIIREGTIEGSTILKDEHLPVFDCALKPEKGKRFLTWEDHVYMMAAIQPFLSGAISKTVNIPSDASVDTIKEIYTTAWKEGVKGIAVYRDGCKGAQPLSTSKGGKKDEAVERVIRSRLPDTRNAVTHKFNVAGHEGYFTVGLYPDNTPGELFIIMSKEGSTIGGIMDAFGTAISMCLQYGVPLKTLVNKFILTRFEPAGFTNSKEIPMATSIIDYLFKWFDLHYIKTTEGEIIEEKPEEVNKLESNNAMIDSKICDNCGSVTIRNGTCFKCPNCGTSLGCS